MPDEPLPYASIKALLFSILEAATALAMISSAYPKLIDSDKEIPGSAMLFGRFIGYFMTGDCTQD